MLDYRYLPCTFAGVNSDNPFDNVYGIYDTDEEVAVENGLKKPLAERRAFEMNVEYLKQKISSHEEQAMFLSMSDGGWSVYQRSLKHKEEARRLKQMLDHLTKPTPHEPSSVRSSEEVKRGAYKHP